MLEDWAVTLYDAHMSEIVQYEDSSRKIEGSFVVVDIGLKNLNNDNPKSTREARMKIQVIDGDSYDCFSLRGCCGNLPHFTKNELVIPPGYEVKGQSACEIPETIAELPLNEFQLVSTYGTNTVFTLAKRAENPSENIESGPRATYSYGGTIPGVVW